MSGGPRTTAGKMKSRGNAATHGLSGAGAVLLPDEDAAEEDARTRALLADLAPAGPLEEAIAGRIVGLLRRARRIDRFEAQIVREHLDGGASLGLAMLRDVPLQGLASLDRHEASIQRNLMRSIALLHDARAVRVRRSTPAPPSSMPGKIT